MGEFIGNLVALSGFVFTGIAVLVSLTGLVVLTKNKLKKNS